MPQLDYQNPKQQDGLRRRRWLYPARAITVLSGPFVLVGGCLSAWQSHRWDERIVGGVEVAAVLVVATWLFLVIKD